MLANYLEAIGTISAVLVALFTQVIREKLKRPKLTMSLSTDREDEDLVFLHLPDGGLQYWLRLRIYAKPGRRTARQVQVFLTRVRKPKGGIVVPSGPLVWSSFGPDPQTLPPGLWRRLDILRYDIPSDGARFLAVALGLFRSNPSDVQVRLDDPGVYELDFSLTADDVESSQWRFRFTHVPNADARKEEDVRMLVKDLTLVRLVTRLGKVRTTGTKKIG